MSFVEAWTNIGVGFGINLIANLTVLPFFGYDVHLSQALGIGVIFTVISVVRSYLLRRFYERLYQHG
jgi:hypothetical protein